MTQFNASQRRALPAAKSNIFTALMLITVINLSVGTGYVLYRFNELYHSYNIFDFSPPTAPPAVSVTAAPAAPAAAPTSAPSK